MINKYFKIKKCKYGSLKVFGNLGIIDPSRNTSNFENFIIYEKNLWLCERCFNIFN